MYVHAGVYVCVKVSGCINECVCVCACVCVWMLVKVGVCILTEVSQHGHDYSPAETNYKKIMTIGIYWFISEFQNEYWYTNIILNY